MSVTNQSSIAQQSLEFAENVRQFDQEVRTALGICAPISSVANGTILFTEIVMSTSGVNLTEYRVACDKLFCIKGMNSSNAATVKCINSTYYPQPECVLCPVDSNPRVVNVFLKYVISVLKKLFTSLFG